MPYIYKATPRFWRSYERLSTSDKQAVKAAWLLFKTDPFDPRLGSHKIHRLSSIYGKTVYAVNAAPDLRVIFTIEGSAVVTLDVGKHEIYRA